MTTTAAAAIQPPPTLPVPPAAPQRLASVDVLRALTILVMIFVNDVAGVRGTPGWMKHIEPPNADGMTFVDVVFPAFLFIVGISIPLALERRLQLGTRLQAFGHVAVRAASLLVIGVFMLNAGSASDAGVLPRAVWTLLMYAGVVLVWVGGPKGRPVQRLAGAALLVAMAVLFRGTGEPALIELRTGWWGILGLIGWAYLVASCVYLAARGRIALLGAGVVLLYGLYFAARLGWVPAVPLLNVGSMLGSHAALTLSGAVLGSALLLPASRFREHRQRIGFALWYGALMALAAVLLHTGREVHPMFIINKIAATPTWCLWSAAITAWLWALTYWLLDVRQATSRAALLADAGQNALLAYILAPICYSLFSLTARVLDVPNYFALLGADFTTGLLRSLVFAFFVTWAAAVLRRRGLVLKL